MSQADRRQLILLVLAMLLGQAISALYQHVCTVEMNETTVDDVVAVHTQWTAKNSGSTNFKAKKIVQYNNRIEVVPTWRFVLLIMVFIGPVALGMGGFVASDSSTALTVGLMLCLGLTIALHYWLVRRRCLTFDRDQGVFYRGQRNAHRQLNSLEGVGIRLADIHALQLLLKYHRGDYDTANYTTYELNLVFKNATRLNVMEVGNEQYIEVASQQLGAFLSVPIWKATAK